MTTAAPRHGTRHLQLNLKLLDNGNVQVTTPQARDYSATPRNPDQLWHAVAGAFRAASAAGEAVWRGEEAEGPRPTRPAVAREGVSWSKHAAARPDLASTEEWLPLDDGSWLSPASAGFPNGRRYRNPRVINPVIARRAALGLPTTWEAQVEHVRQVEQAAAEVDEARRFWDRVEAADGSVSRWHTSDGRNRAAAS